MLAAIRPDSWNLPLLLHVFGAMVLVGGLVVAVAAQFLAWRRRDDAAAFGRVAFRALLFVAFPAWWVMRVGGQWIYSKEGLDELDPEPGWVGIGFVTADFGGLLLLVSIILAGLGLRGQRSVLGRIATVLAAIVLVAYLVAMWAMTAKPD
jgi:hypothetical protein